MENVIQISSPLCDPTSPGFIIDSDPGSFLIYCPSETGLIIPVDNNKYHIVHLTLHTFFGHHPYEGLTIPSRALGVAVQPTELLKTRYSSSNLKTVLRYELMYHLMGYQESLSYIPFAKYSTTVHGYPFASPDLSQVYRQPITDTGNRLAYLKNRGVGTIKVIDVDKSSWAWAWDKGSRKRLAILDALREFSEYYSIPLRKMLMIGDHEKDRDLDEEFELNSHATLFHAGTFTAKEVDEFIHHHPWIEFKKVGTVELKSNARVIPLILHKTNKIRVIYNLFLKSMNGLHDNTSSPQRADVCDHNHWAVDYIEPVCKYLQD